MNWHQVLVVVARNTRIGCRASWPTRTRIGRLVTSGRSATTTTTWFGRRLNADVGVRRLSQRLLTVVVLVGSCPVATCSPQCQAPPECPAVTAKAPRYDS
jgi:hypothetical protein